jgi:uncharacterized protein
MHMDGAHGRFVWYELMTTDVGAAKAFYADVFGWGTRDSSMPGSDYVLFTLGETAIGGMAELPDDARKAGATPQWLGYVGVDDVDAAAERVALLGGTVQVPPTDIPNISRYAIVADPQMAALVLLKWLNPVPKQAVEPGASGRVVWHELLAGDSRKAFGFYADLFGWKKADAAVDAMGTYQMFSAGGQTLGGMFTKPPAVSIPFWLYYFSVGDIDTTASRVKAAGGRILEGPIDLPRGTRIARCLDPQGAMFALTATRSGSVIGYFEPSDSASASSPRLFVRR